MSIQRIVQTILDFIKGLFGKGMGAPEQKPPKSNLMDIARAEIGVSEVVGRDHNPVVLQYYADAGFPEIDDDETPWCAAFANAMLKRAGYHGSKSLAARSFLNWGKKVSTPYYGCVVVFSRGNPRGWTGHVGFYVGETDTHILVLGGNQRNKVSIAHYPKNRLLGYRKPVTVMNSRTYRAAATGATSAAVGGGAILFKITEALEISTTLRSLGDDWLYLVLAGLVLSVGSHIYTLKARQDDLEEKGR